MALTYRVTVCVTSEVVEEGSQVQHSILKGLTLLDNGVFSSQYAHRGPAARPAHYGRAQARLPHRQGQDAQARREIKASQRRKNQNFRRPLSRPPDQTTPKRIKKNSQTSLRPGNVKHCTWGYICTRVDGNPLYKDLPKCGFTSQQLF